MVLARKTKKKGDCGTKKKIFFDFLKNLSTLFHTPKNLSKTAAITAQLQREYIRFVVIYVFLFKNYKNLRKA